MLWNSNQREKGLWGVLSWRVNGSLSRAGFDVISKPLSETCAGAGNAVSVLLRWEPVVRVPVVVASLLVWSVGII